MSSTPLGRAGLVEHEEVVGGGRARVVDAGEGGRAQLELAAGLDGEPATCWQGLDIGHDALGLLERQPAAVGVDGEELELDADRGALVDVRGGGQIVFPAMLDRVGERE